MDISTIRVVEGTTGLDWKLVYINENNQLSILLQSDMPPSGVTEINVVKNSVIALYGKDYCGAYSHPDSNIIRYYTQAEDGDSGFYTMIIPQVNSLNLSVEDIY